MTTAGPASRSRLPPLSDPARQIVADAVDSLAQRGEQFRVDFDALVLSQVETVRPLAGTIADTLDRSTRAQMATLVSFLRTWTDPALVRNSSDALNLGRDLHRLGVQMDSLVAIYNRGHEFVWEHLYEELRARIADPDLFAETVRAVSSYLFAYLDAILQPLLDDFVAERERRARLAETGRAEEVRRILAGDTVNPDRAAARLGYELRRWHLGFVAWVPPETDEEDVRPRLDSAAAELSDALAAEQPPLVVSGTSFTVHGWLGSYSRPHPMAALPRIPGVYLALGEPGEGLAGFRTTHQQALLARRVATLARRRAGSSLAYRDVAVEALLTADLAQAREFARGVLGPLAADDDNARRLLATLQVFYEEDASVRKAGQRLNLHHNTIAYRVNRAIELLEGEDGGSLRLRLAVLLAPLLKNAEADGEPTD
jgi:DNA-binding PucR family transcriptional regulator